MKANGRGAGYKNGFDANPPSFIDPIRWQDQPVPERRWLVPDWIPLGTVTGLYGDGGIGKSLIVQQLLTASAIERNWISLRTKPAKTIGLFCEDSEDELHIRQNDINNFYQCEFADLVDVRYYPRVGEDNLLMVFSHNGIGELTPFYDAFLEQCMDFGAEAISIDTIADTFGGNENDRGQVRQYVQMVLGGLARATNGAVIALAHPSRTGLNSGSGDGGSTAWSNTFRSRLYFHSPKNEATEEETNSNDRVLSRMKANYAPRDDTAELRWHEGVFINTRIDETGFMGTIKRQTAERVFLGLLAAIKREGQHVSNNPYSRTYAPTLFAKRPDREKFTRGDFDAAMQRLFATNQIKITPYLASNRSTGEEISIV